MRMLEFDNVRVRIGSVDVLRDVSLTVDAGEAVGLVGETGSGKTMTVRAATGLLRPIGGRVAAGSVRVAGTDMTTAGDKQWRRLQGRRIALVPQSSMSSLNPLVPIGKQLAETVRLRLGASDVAGEVSRALASVQLVQSDRLLASYPHELSGGMRQRVMIALALTCRPDILIADEPTTALDASIRGEILALLGALREEQGLALLLISHDLSAIATATERVVVMYGGTTVEAGSTDDIVTAPRHPYTAALIAAHPDHARPGERIAVIGGHPPAPGEIVAGCGFAPRCRIAVEACHAQMPALRPLQGAAADHVAACLRADEVDARALYETEAVR